MKFFFSLITRSPHHASNQPWFDLLLLILLLQLTNLVRQLSNRPITRSLDHPITRFLMRDHYLFCKSVFPGFHYQCVDATN
ncbi:MAG: hypothetical protein WBP41_18920, partial [Saprospiraceae bacterium]